MATLTSTVPQIQHEKSGLLQRFAVERLKHTVSELQTLVDHDRRNQPLPPPKPTTLHLITDSSALTTSVSEIKTYVNDESAKITVPLPVLDVLDSLKRGNDPENVSARETVRWFDRILSRGGSEKGVKVQGPSEVYGTWTECLEWYNPPPTSAVPDVDSLEIGLASPGAMTESMMLETTEMMEATAISPPSSPPLAPTTPRLLKAGTFSARNGRPLQSIKTTPGNLKRAATTPLQEPPSPTSPLRAPEVPRRIQPIINCALECLHSEKNELSKRDEGVLFLVTNNPETSHWATCFGIPVLNTKELATKIYEENRLYKEKKLEWQAAQNARENGYSHSNNHSSVSREKSSFGNPKNMDELLEVGAKFDPSKKSANTGGRGRGNGNGNTNANQNENGNANNNPSGRRRHRNNQNAQQPAFNPSNRGGRVGRGGYQLPFARNAAVNAAPKDFSIKQDGNSTNNNVSSDQQVFPLSPNSNGFHQRDGIDGAPDYVLGRGANRGVARGRGKLWTP